MIPPKEHNKLPVTSAKEKEIHELLDKECKIIVLKELSKLQENIDKQFN